MDQQPADEQAGNDSLGEEIPSIEQEDPPTEVPTNDNPEVTSGYREGVTSPVYSPSSTPLDLPSPAYPSPEPGEEVANRRLAQQRRSDDLQQREQENQGS